MLGTILGIGGSIFGGIAGAKAANKAQEQIKEQQKKNEEWYNRRYNEDATQRADAIAMLNKTKDFIKERNKQAEGVAAVMGTPAGAVAVEKANNNAIIGDVTSQIIANNEARKDMIEQTYMDRDQNYQSQLNQMQLNKANQIAEATKGIVKASTSMYNSQRDNSKL